MTRAYPAEVRERAVALYRALGLTAAAEATGVSEPTIYKWLGEFRLSPSDADGMTGGEAAKAARITYRQLDYWCSSGFIAPSVGGLRGSGINRRYTPEQVEELRVAGELTRWGVALTRLRKMSPDDRARLLVLLAREDLI